MAKGILWAVPTVWAESDDQVFPTIPHIHCTIAYGVERSDVEQWIGHDFPGRITGYAIGDSAECLLLFLPGNIPFTGKNPHITLSHSPEVGPIASKEMLESGNCKITEWNPTWPIGMRMEFLGWEE